MSAIYYLWWILALLLHAAPVTLETSPIGVLRF